LPLYVLRHAESLANVAGLIACDPATAIEGFGLTQRGFQQVRTAELPFGEAERVRIVSSDFRRARETASTLAQRLGAPEPELSVLLRERNFAPFEGQTSNHYQTVWAHDAAGTNCPGVETIEEVCLRLDALLVWLRSGGSDVASTILVSHGDVLQILLARELGMSPRLHRGLEPLGNAECRAVGLRFN